MAVLLLSWRAETPLERTGQLISMVFHLAHLNWHMMGNKNIVKPWPQTLSPKPPNPKPKTLGPWADTKML